MEIIRNLIEIIDDTAIVYILYRWMVGPVINVQSVRFASVSARAWRMHVMLQQTSKHFKAEERRANAKAKAAVRDAQSFAGPGGFRIWDISVPTGSVNLCQIDSVEATWPTFNVHSRSRFQSCLELRSIHIQKDLWEYSTSQHPNAKGTCRCLNRDFRPWKLYTKVMKPNTSSAVWEGWVEERVKEDERGIVLQWCQCQWWFFVLLVMITGWQWFVSKLLRISECLLLPKVSQMVCK